MTKDVPPYSIVAGIPAKVLRYRFEPHQIFDLLKLKWWDLADEELIDIQWNDIEDSISKLQEKRSVPK